MQIIKIKNNVNVTYVPRLVTAAILLQFLPFYGGQRCQSHRSENKKHRKNIRREQNKGE